MIVRRRISQPPTEVFRFDAASFELGLLNVEATKGEQVRIYDPARAVVDLTRFGIDWASRSRMPRCAVAGAAVTLVTLPRSSPDPGATSAAAEAGRVWLRGRRDGRVPQSEVRPAMPGGVGVLARDEHRRSRGAPGSVGACGAAVTVYRRACERLQRVALPSVTRTVAGR
jgi:hypothetical protein